MWSRLPKQFGIRTLLILVAIVAVGTLVIRDYVQLRSARERFEYAWALWDAGRISVEDTVFESQKLYAAEVSSPWISEHSATQHHVERMKWLLADIENPARDSSEEWVAQHAYLLRREINKLRASPSAADNR